jgi:hypothetical protein
MLGSNLLALPLGDVSGAAWRYLAPTSNRCGEKSDLRSLRFGKLGLVQYLKHKSVPGRRNDLADVRRGSEFESLFNIGNRLCG